VEKGKWLMDNHAHQKALFLKNLYVWTSSAGKNVLNFKNNFGLILIIIIFFCFVFHVTECHQVIIVPGGPW